jgi:hypothetical protein
LSEIQIAQVLVGNYPGRALSFTTRKEALDRPKVVGYPSKAVGLFVPETLIFRSDSNGEDLAGFAGAGLYDSITMDPTRVRGAWATLLASERAGCCVGEAVRGSQDQRQQQQLTSCGGWRAHLMCWRLMR